MGVGRLWIWDCFTRDDLPNQRFAINDVHDAKRLMFGPMGYDDDPLYLGVSPCGLTPYGPLAEDEAKNAVSMYGQVCEWPGDECVHYRTGEPQVAMNFIEAQGAKIV